MQGEKSATQGNHILKERSDECDINRGEVCYTNARTPKNRGDIESFTSFRHNRFDMHIPPYAIDEEDWKTGFPGK